MAEPQTGRARAAAVAVRERRRASARRGVVRILLKILEMWMNGVNKNLQRTLTARTARIG
jgi:hypothetical protein